MMVRKRNTQTWTINHVGEKEGDTQTWTINNVGEKQRDPQTWTINHGGVKEGDADMDHQPWWGERGRCRHGPSTMMVRKRERQTCIYVSVVQHV